MVAVSHGDIVGRVEANLTVVDSELSVTVPATSGVLAAAGVDQKHSDANGNVRDEVECSAVRSGRRETVTQTVAATQSVVETVLSFVGEDGCDWDHTGAELRDDEGQVDHPTVRAGASHAKGIVVANMVSIDRPSFVGSSCRFSTCQVTSSIRCNSTRTM